MATILEQGFESGIGIYKKRNRNENLIERFVNDKGYELLGDKKVQESISFFRLNVFAFPRSANAYDSLGESYLEAGNQALAIENYRKSLELNPDNRNAEQVLKRLANK
jgi:tetratricopeptide (TPR) repeat protein